MLLLWLFLLLPIKAQTSINTAEATPVCTFDHDHQQLLQTDPVYAEKVERANALIAEKTAAYWAQQTTANTYAKSGGAGGVISIPTVVHILHHPDSLQGMGGNPTNEMVYTAIDYLNQAFRNNGAYDPSIGTDMEIEFCLAVRTPFGFFTNGITRTANVTYAFLDKEEDEAMKMNTGWDREKYFNIWIPTGICSSALDICNIAGYSNLASYHGANRDGIVCRSDFFGTSPNKTKVLIHELGHWLNLYHTFEGGCQNNNCLMQGDFVCDTPPDASQFSYLCTAVNSCLSDGEDSNIRNPFRAVNLGGQGEQNDMIENYMDYGNYECQNAFTLNQKERIHLSFDAFRSSLLQSNACVSPISNDAAITEIVSPNNAQCSGDLIVTLHNAGLSPLNSCSIFYQIDGGAITPYAWTGFLPSGECVEVLVNTTLSFLPGQHTLKVYTESPNGGIDNNSANDEKSNTFVALSSQSLPFNEDFSAISFSSKWGKVNPDNSIGWQTVGTSGCGSTGTRSAYINNHAYNNIGETDYLYTLLNLNDYADANLSFDVAYVPQSNFISDRLRVVISTDCGESFHEIYDKSAGDLMTGISPQNAAWSPNSCTQWRTESINLMNYAREEVIIGFAATTSQGNNLYLDNVHINGTEYIECASPGSVNVNNITANTATITWTNGEPGVNFYQVQYKTVGSNSWLGTQLVTGNSLELYGLFTNTNYYVEVQTICASGLRSEATATSFVTVFTSCPPMSSVEISDVYKHGFTVSWTPIPGISLYSISYYPASSPSSVQTTATFDNQMLISGLPTGVLYQVEVAVVCDGGVTSPPSTPIYVSPELICRPPDNINVLDVSAECAVLKWDQGEDDISFSVRYKKANDINWASSFTISTNIYLLEGLESGTNYELEISTTCTGVLVSEYGYRIAFSTPPSCSYINALSMNASAITETSASISWDNSPDAEQYELEYRPQGFSGWTPYTSNNTFASLNGLVPCTTYEYRVRGICSNESTFCTSQGGFSSIKTFVTACSGGSAAEYCAITGVSASSNWIQEVRIGTYNNFSGTNNGYGDFTNLSYNLGRNETFAISLTQGTPSRNDNVFWSIWIDFDQNKTFEANEQVFSKNTANEESIVFDETPLTVHSHLIIPSSALLGATRMRVALGEGTVPEACTSFLQGEVEDYTLIINEGGKGENTIINAESITLGLQPNPAQNQVLIYYSTPENTPCKISIFDVMGRIVFTENKPSTSQTISSELVNIDHLSKGVYFVQVDNGQERVSKKLLVLGK